MADRPIVVCGKELARDLELLLLESRPDLALLDRVSLTSRRPRDNTLVLTVQEHGANTPVVAHTHSNLLDVRSQLLANVGDFVDERDFGRQEGV